MKVQDKFSFGSNWHRQFTLKRDKIDAIEVRPISKNVIILLFISMVVHQNGAAILKMKQKLIIKIL